MNLEDYFKYYIQGSDHYLIPRDVFKELFNEMENWREEAKELKEKYLNAVADYEKTMFEKEQLNSLVNSCQEEIRQLKKQLEEYKATNKILSHELTKDKVLQQDCLTTCCGIPIGDIPKLITQQKEFIDYMEEKIICYENYQNTNLGEYERNLYFDIYNDILEKYKEIIGGKE